MQNLDLAEEEKTALITKLFMAAKTQVKTLEILMDSLQAQSNRYKFPAGKSARCCDERTL